MKEILDIIDELKANNDSYENKTRVLRVVCNAIQSQRALARDVAQKIIDFAIDAIRRLATVIPETPAYKDKDVLFEYCDALLMLVTVSTPDKSLLTNEHIDAIRNIIDVNNKERTLENAVSSAFESATINLSDVTAAIEITKSTAEPYRRGLFFFGLHHYAEKLRSLPNDIRSALSAFTVSEFAALLSREMCDDEITYMEYAVDVCKYFYTDEIGDALERIINVCPNRVVYYAVETLIAHGRTVTKQAIDALAHDLSYADITHDMLNKYGKRDLFPADCLDPDYLATSNMVRWLEYPTELGKRPDKIELLGKAVKKGETYHIFKFMSDSDTLADENKNVWLIGWAGSAGGTFSNFDLLSDHQKKTPDKTLKHIVKKLI